MHTVAVEAPIPYQDFPRPRAHGYLLPLLVVQHRSASNPVLSARYRLTQLKKRVREIGAVVIEAQCGNIM